MKRLIVLLIMLIAIAVPAAGQVTMPYCDCVELTYAPMGPALPNDLQSEQVWGIWDDLPGLTGGLCQDIGDLPYSIPFHGWHCDETGGVYPVNAEIFAVGNAINIKLSNLVCCGNTVDPSDPLFNNTGVTLPWDGSTMTYMADVYNKRYVVVVSTIPEGSWTVFDLYHGVYTSGGHLSMFLSYRILAPYDRRPPQDERIFPVEVE